MAEADTGQRKLACHLLEITPMPGVRYSLNLGYLHAAAAADQECEAAYEFHKHVLFQAPDIVDRIDGWLAGLGRVDVLAVSVYFWNRHPSMRFAEAVKRKWPQCTVVLGGNDVTHQQEAVFAESAAVDYLVHGEGEFTFRDLLKELARSSAGRGAAGIPGISFRRAGKICTVPVGERISDLSSIPSPLLSGVYSPEEIRDSRVIILETNRGCPYSCAFCYWGGATRSKVRPFPLQRIKDEISFVVRHASPEATLFIADANFGIIGQDVEIAEWLVAELRRFDKRIFLFTNWAKNTSKRVLAIADILYSGNVIAAVTLSAQSFTPEVLAIARRTNIKPAYYRSLQGEFERRGIPTYTELIWGMPGESVETFLAGLEYVIASGGSPVVYPLLLLNNTEYTTSAFRDDHAVRTRRLPYQITNAEMQAEFVIEHAEMTEAEWLELMELRLTMAVFHAGLLRGLIRAVSRLTGRRVVDLCRVLNDWIRRTRTTAVLDALVRNHRAVWTDADAYDRELVAGLIGTDVIPDHTHYQAVMTHLLSGGAAEQLVGLAAARVWQAVSADGTLDADIFEGLVAFQIAAVRALRASVTGEPDAAPVTVTLTAAVHDLLVEVGQLHAREAAGQEVDVRLDGARFAGAPADSFLLAIYHGSVQVPKSFQVVEPGL
ncbi:B12-binding domain-containing radical SAM protein [Actinacidiphila yeochonensis]|uniref:B12-binding domain-containing radical SAM protein n=1 Tax=Actinacidiphila yeochonensis TaxID=89050 RepID=UPI00068DAE4C|nr:B12-binding domain-containing radical SAM protein [Actinacidiphila yeochonensis]